jgi:hypothetical protein
MKDYLDHGQTWRRSFNFHMVLRIFFNGIFIEVNKVVCMFHSTTTLDKWKENSAYFTINLCTHKNTHVIVECMHYLQIHFCYKAYMKHVMIYFFFWLIASINNIKLTIISERKQIYCDNICNHTFAHLQPQHKNHITNTKLKWKRAISL